MAIKNIRDQAMDLRRIVDSSRRPPAVRAGLRSIAVLSGKGGVGKSNLSVNLALAMAERGRRVVLLDADMGMANVDLLCGLTPGLTLAHILRGESALEDILLPLAENVWILPGGPGVRELADLDERLLSAFIDSLSALEGTADVLFIDTGAGIHKSVISFGAAADDVLLVTTPEPTSIRDAYGALKALAFSTAGKVDVTVAVNMASSFEEGQDVAERITAAASRFLGLTPRYGGAVLRDENVSLAVKKRTPLLKAFPDSEASGQVRAMAARILGLEEDHASPAPGRGIKSFFLRLARSLGAGR
ncbi:MAG: MinD/ParA family protein [Aminivibrio sp.]